MHEYICPGNNNKISINTRITVINMKYYEPRAAVRNDPGSGSIKIFFFSAHFPIHRLSLHVPPANDLQNVFEHTIRYVALCNEINTLLLTPIKLYAISSFYLFFEINK